MRCFRVLLAGAIALSSAVSAFAISPGDVVFSVVYGGGGNANAQYNKDFVQLFNRTNSSISLAGFTIQYASAAGSFTNQVLLTGTINAGSYYLVGLSPTGATGAAITPDENFTSITASATSGKFALASDNVQVSGASASNVVDFVGYGTANQAETTAVGALSNSTAAVRNFQTSGGNNVNYVDTNNNSADFTISNTFGSQNGSTGNPFGSNFQPVPAPPAAISLAIGGLVGLVGTGANKLRSRSAKRKLVGK